MTSHVAEAVFQPPAGQTAKDEEATLKEQFPQVQKGLAREVPEHLRDEYVAACEAITAWETRKTLILNQARRYMGDAQIGAINGEPVFSRRRYTVQEHVVPAYDVDGLWPANTKSPN